MSVTLLDIQEAQKRIEGGVIRSPCPASVPLSNATGMQIYCKLEYLQRTGSFKERGARNALLKLSPDQKKRGVIAASAGNHALGLACHGQLLGIPVTVVMPVNAPQMKLSNCRLMGAEVILHGGNIGEAAAHAREIMGRKGLTYINGFNDADVIAGQGTLGLEILEQVPDVEAVIVPIGGAGLIAGIALAIKTLKPKVRVIGVCSAAALSYLKSLEAGKPVPATPKPTLADGLAVPQVGDRAFEIARPLLDKVVAVNEASIALAILRLVELEKAVVEGAGAVPLAACLSGLLRELAGAKVVIPLCGGNIDTHILGHIIERGLVADGRLWRFSTLISDRPGGLASFSALLAAEGASVRELYHDRAHPHDDLNIVRVHCLVETRDRDHIEHLAQKLQISGYPPDLV